MDPPPRIRILNKLVIRPHIVPLLPTFHGMESENPYSHIKEFEEDQWVEKTNLKFFAKENEKFHECWERYMEAINACPHHGFDTWLLVSRGWDEPNSREKGKFHSQQTQNLKAGMYMLSEDVDMKAKVATLARRLEELELKRYMKSKPFPIPKSMSCHAPFANHVIMW
ncbi:hypothetical protein AAG906_027998 [Vitis piasezkii]